MPLCFKKQKGAWCQGVLPVQGGYQSEGQDRLAVGRSCPCRQLCDVPALSSCSLTLQEAALRWDYGHSLAAADLCHLLLSSSRHPGQPCFKGEASTVIGGRREEQVSVLQLRFSAVFDAKLLW